MLEIIEPFEISGLFVGPFGTIYYGSVQHISFLIETIIGGTDGLKVDDIQNGYVGPALVRITMPATSAAVALIKSLESEEPVSIEGFICKDTEGATNYWIYYGTHVERLSM